MQVNVGAAAGIIVSGKDIKFAEAFKNVTNHIRSGKVFDHLEKIQND